MFENFIDRYSQTKTVCFELLPIENTEERIKQFNLLERDQLRSEVYEKVKGYIDEYHKNFIEATLNDVILTEVEDYAKLYYKRNKDASDMKKMERLEASMRKEIANTLTEHPFFATLNNKDIIEKELTNSEVPEEKAAAQLFHLFTGYFNGYFTNRKNMYSAEAKSTAISYRCINENLPKFLNNISTYDKILDSFSEKQIEDLNEMATRFHESPIYINDLFTYDYFSFVLSQSGIDEYNAVIGEINKHINDYNQKLQKHEKELRLPMLKILYKQILSDRETEFILGNLENDNEVLQVIRDYYSEIKDVVTSLRNLFANFNNFNKAGIFVSSSAITEISTDVYGTYCAVERGWGIKYEKEHPLKDTEKYRKDKKKAYKNSKSFSIDEIQSYGNSYSGCNQSVSDYISKSIIDACDAIIDNYKKANALLITPYPSDGNLRKDKKSIELIKELLDSTKDLEHLLKPLLGTKKEDCRDDVFYGEFFEKYDAFLGFDPLYNKVRNYTTSKPYSLIKFPLNFGIPNLMNGWVDCKTENSDNGTQYCSYLFRVLNAINEYDYVLVISKNTKLFRYGTEVSDGDRSIYERLDYYQPKEQTVYGSAYKGIRPYSEDRKEIIEVIRDIADVTAKVEILLDIDDYCSSAQSSAVGLLKLIRNIDEHLYDKILKSKNFQRVNKGLINNLKKTIESMSKLKNSESILDKEYELFPDIMTDITELLKQKSYNYIAVSESELRAALADEKRPLLMFKISNKDLRYAEDFSKGLRKTRGKEDLNTRYFKALMSGCQSTFDLGAGQLFCRPLSLKRGKPTHPANVPIKNKNDLNFKRTSTFSYDLFKNERFMETKILLHLSTLINYSASKSSNINDDVRAAIKRGDVKHVIGIDRGERNLLYVSVIDLDGNIVEQKSLNVIVSDRDYAVDYHELLEKRERKRDKSRRSWNEIESIKDLKKGYMSQAVHEICKLMIKYDAIIVIEDLNAGFMNSRKKIEKQVYDKFEAMLLGKLRYLVNKNLDDNEDGGICRGYQLVNDESYSRESKQDGFLFRVPAWLTSKIDPTTGFVDLLRPKYTTDVAARELISRFDDIKYNPDMDMFELSFDYNNFPRCNTDFQQRWTIFTNGERLYSFRNPEKNLNWDETPVNLTMSLKDLFARTDIDYTHDLKEQIVDANKSGFYREFIRLLGLTLQMRNSKTSDQNVDYIISPVMNSDGKFYNSDDYKNIPNSKLPKDADANGAYNIARKGLWAINQIKDDINAKVSIRNADWLEFAQK